MLAEAVFFAALQIGPFFEKNDSGAALRPLWSQEGDVTDVAWPLFTSHRDWWRFLFFVHSQSYSDDGGQFEVTPLWYHGRDDSDGKDYFGLFPLYGTHPHFLFMYDLEFVLWPVWTRYRMPRPSENRWMTSNAVLFPFFSWRDDGSWGVWPLCGISRNRTDTHRYTLWPLFNWADYRRDRDTAGEGTSWMFWPLAGAVDREREKQWLLLPPLVSYAETPSCTRLRLPWPFFELERGTKRNRLSVFPFYEHITNFSYADGARQDEITRFGWRLVELLPGETRVFPFWVDSDDGYMRVWPFYERIPSGDGTFRSRVLSLFPIRHASAVDRNWAKFWTFYESESTPIETRHSLFWGIINWRTGP